MGSTAIALILAAVSQEASLPEGLLSAVCFVESSHRAHVIREDDGGHNSVGLCQVQLRTAHSLGFKGDEKKLLTPKVNAFYAAKYLNYQYRRYGSWDKAVIAYNRGNAAGLEDSKYLRKVKKVINGR